MIKSIQEALDSGKLQEILSARNELRYLYKIDERLLGDLIRLLEPFDVASRHPSAGKTPTIHLTLPTRVTLLKGLHVDPDDSDVTSQLKEMLARKVEEKLPIHIIHKMATSQP
ncbi:hypothetical protein AAFF_G00114400 [Aldrovandia affinis]|uniref:Uncharacterized protein n=1 Tax=Aldrovandia affinis TaxID=143900 RepID=A0AAD7RST6_9TELE|nr:hypothetical protein AAFF_G00114400 [Aldrovandia affinis]